MKTEAYETFAEWKSDLDRMHKHPNDSQLSSHVVRRINASSDQIKVEIREFLLDKALEDNPWLVLEKAAHDHPGYKVMIKNTQDPWFGC